MKRNMKALIAGMQPGWAGSGVDAEDTLYRDNKTKIVMSPLELMQRLAAPVHRPRLNLIRFNGVLAPAFSNPFDPALTHLIFLNDWADLFLWVSFA